MIETIHSADIYVKDTQTPKGRGVFARREFVQGELVEACPVIILLCPYDQIPPRLKNVVFNWAALSNDKQPSNAVSLGFGSMYNHDNPANIRYQAVPENQALHYIAARTIHKDEELTINYNSGGGDPISDEDNWFKNHNIELLN